MIGTTVSQYKIVSKLGEGGMGEVYLAEDTELGRQVALKVLPQTMAEDPERLERFQREAKAIAALNHPNIVTIYHVEETDGRRLLIMEMVEGESLDKLITPGGLALAKVFDIAIPLADALSAAHEKNIVHRDLKPANIMVTPEGRVKVLDFGLAKIAAGPITNLSGDDATQTAGLTTEGTVMGTAPYMSPEQLHGHGVDHRTDIFSLGIVLYEMATGARPFKGESGIDLASSILKDMPVTATEVRGDLPRHLARIIHTCLEKDPRRRYQSALDVRNELDRLKDEVKSGSTSAVGAPISASQATYDSGPASAVGSGPSSAVGSGAAAAVPADSESGVTSGPAATVSTGATPTTGGKGLWIGLVAAALVLVALGAWWLGRGSGDSTAPEAEDAVAETSPAMAADMDSTPSVAVLPFADLSPEKDQEYFTDGMTEELLHALGAIDGLKVPSRTAIFALKDKNLTIDEIGQHLGVSTVLEGSVRKSGDQLRIAAQLVQVSDGFELWSETYNRELEDVFAVQDEIASSIADALQVTLVTETETGGTDNTEAYDFYLRGKGYIERQGTENQRFAMKMYNQAIDLDPNYALAYSALAMAHVNLYELAGANSEDVAATDQASAKALELAPDLVEAHRARAGYFQISGDETAAEAEYKAAIELDPTRSDTYYAYGRMMFQLGDLEKTAQLWEKSIELDPLESQAINLLPQVYVSLERDEAQIMAAIDKAFRFVSKHLELNPDDYANRIVGAIYLMQLGQREQAFEWAQEVLDSGVEDSLTLYNTACLYSMAGDADASIDALSRAIDAGDRDADWWRQDSDLDYVRQDPRFEELLKRMDSGS